MALSYVTYTGDGATTVFAFNKGYLRESHVTVKVDGVLQVDPTDYDWISATSIQFVSAPGNGLAVSLVRSTPNTAREVDFEDGSNVTEATMDKDSDQLMYIAQETLDTVTDNIAGAGNVPGPSNPSENDYILAADSGVFDWVALGAAIHNALGGASGNVLQHNGSGAYVSRTLAAADIAVASRTITAGTGLTGGGDLTANRTVSLDLDYSGLQALASGTVAGAVTLEILGLTSDYAAYFFVASEIIPSTDGNALHAQFTNDGGSSWIGDTGSPYWWAHVFAGTTSVVQRFVSSASASLQTNAGNFGTASLSEVRYLHMWVHHAGVADLGPNAHWESGGVTATPEIITSSGAGAAGPSNADVDGFRLYFPGGNIARMRYTLYGLRRAA